MSSLLSPGVIIIVILFNFTAVRASIVAPTPAFRKIINVSVHRCGTIAILFVIQIKPLTDIPNILEGIVAALRSLITFKSIFAGFFGYTRANEDKGILLTLIPFIDLR